MSTDTLMPENATSAAARRRRDAAERARKWRAEQSATAALNSAIVAGLARAVARDRAGQEGEVPVDGGRITLRAVINQAAKHMRNEGGVEYNEALLAVGVRLSQAVEAVARP